ncbi:zinc ribbon domain-containing protein [Actinoplanes sp. NPDC049316]|uniref:zinc ribbon domain-containing protein n=1 Tax=Actinoplanes sp. NPDC049316 TaxID=3154727 RepID=UPI0034343802
MVIIPSEAEVILDVARRLLAGETMTSIVADLRARKVPTVTGALWMHHSMTRLMGYPRLAGLREREGKLVKADWPAILTRAQHKKLTSLFNDPERGQPQATNTRKYLLSGGLLSCEFPVQDDEGTHPCGKTLYTQPSAKGTRGYVCRSGSPSYGCGRIRIAAPALEEIVAARALARLASPQVLDRLRRAVGAFGTDGFSIEQDLKDLDDRLREAGEQYARRELSMTTLQAIEKQGKIERKQLLERAKQADRLLSMPAPEALADWWVDASVDQQRELLSLVLDHVKVKPAARRGNVPLDTDRLEFVWK